jgi:hypothetical protein
MSFPIILEYSDACAEIGRKKIKIPTIAATAVILASRGADRLLVPCPSSNELERTEAGLELLPRERRSCVRIVDKNATVLKAVREYLRPLKAQARQWPEDAFVGFAEDFLYQVALATVHRSGILADSVQTLRGFIPILRPNYFQGEARFRLAELVGLICSYEPHPLDHGSLRLETSSKDSFSPSVWSLLDNAQFRTLVSVSGKLGYAKHPLVGVKRLQQAIRTFVKRDDTRRMLSLVATTADLAGAETIRKTTETLFETLVGTPQSSFRPPILELGPTTLGIYRTALSADPRATPPQGTIMVFEHGRAGRGGLSWLSVGEETKLETEAAQPERRREDHRKARAAMDRFLT